MILISDQKEFQEKKNTFISDGVKNFHILSDFDRTLTKAFVNGKIIGSVISELRDKNYISEEYTKKSKGLAEIYSPIEHDIKITLKEKKEKMLEWWKKHFDLLISSGLNREHILELVIRGRTAFRKGVLEFFDLTHSKKIPLVIVSSSGLGGDFIDLFLKQHKKNYENVHILSNSFIWNSKGFATRVKKPIIHVFNKDETILREFDFYKEINKRKNILLLGDSLGDPGMLNGADYKEVIKIGFLNYNIEENLKEYKKAYDVLILNDSGFDFINDLLKEIVNK